ncbi:MAG: 1-deoxy-D-xylulose-5-phosphate synthase, partial [Chitinophagaceae bacterium]|nr:1-deoxy-D-xylulose-5-phosphate synthase [Chitinophagaceae bacterium]
VIRYPRGEGVMPVWQTPFENLRIGKGEQIQAGENIAILSVGHPGNFVVNACKNLNKAGIQVSHYNMLFIKPLDFELLHEIGKKYTHVITVEDGCIPGGFGSACLEFFAEHGYKPTVKILGIPDLIIEHGKPSELHKECGYDQEAIERAVMNLVNPEMQLINSSLENHSN